MCRNLRLDHLAIVHFESGETLRDSRPDFKLFQFLWAKRLIGEEDYKELRSGNHNLSRPPGNVVTVHSAREDRVRERHRTQTIGVRNFAVPLSRIGRVESVTQ